MPAMPPRSARMVLSVSNWRTNLPRVAPSAMRSAISWVRAADRASSRFATLAHAIKQDEAHRAEQHQQRPVGRTDNFVSPWPQRHTEAVAVIAWMFPLGNRRPPR